MTSTVCTPSRKIRATPYARRSHFIPSFWCCNHTGSDEGWENGIVFIPLCSSANSQSKQDGKDTKNNLKEFSLDPQRGIKIYLHSSYSTFAPGPWQISCGQLGYFWNQRGLFLFGHGAAINVHNNSESFASNMRMTGKGESGVVFHPCSHTNIRV